MSFMGPGGVASGPASGLRFAQTRGRIQGSPVTGVNYPSPFFDVAHTYLPVTVKQLFKWCRYYFLTNPLINATVFKLSEYPVTDIIIDHESTEVKNRWTEYFHDHLRWQPFRVECGLDFFGYGNGCISVGFPFKKYLYCKSCNFRDEAGKIRAQWIFTSFQFRMTCPRCGYIGDALAKDYYYKNASGIKTIRWNPEDIEISYNDISGEYTYFYTIPAVIRNDIVIGRKDVVEGIPQVFIQAMREQKGVIFSKDNFFHMRRPTLATQDRGWGTPLLLPVLKDTFYLQIMKKAQEAILLEHIIPLRVLFPQAGSGSSDPYCLTYRTLTEANYGYKASGDVVVGDIVKTASGRYAPVTAVKKRAVKPGEKVYSIEVTGMSAVPVEPSEDHPFLAVRTGGRIKSRVADWTADWVPAKDLQVGDYVAYPIGREVRHGMSIDTAQYLQRYIATERWVYQQITPMGAAAYEYAEAREQRAFANGELQQVAAEKGWAVSTLQGAASKYRRGHRTPRMPRHIEWSKDFATILGYYLAEGSVEETRITYALHREETWICDELDAAFSRLLGLRGTRHPTSDNGMSYRVNASSFAEFLKSYGGHLAWNKRLPEECVHLPEEILLELVRCLINGDGGAEQAYRDNGTGRPCRTSAVTHTTTSLQLALKLRELLLYLGVIGRVHSTPVRSRRKHMIHRVKINGQMAVDLWKRLGWSCNETAEIKKDTTRSFILGDYAYFRVQKKTELVGVDFVYGFQVDGDKSFCVPSCAQHNTTINLLDWRDQVAAEIARWRLDGNYIPILPLPIGNQTIGGDGKALMLTQEIETWSNQILNGMGVPVEFIRGGLSYAGTNVSMRMMENMFLGYISRQKALAKFVMKQVSSFLGWPEAGIRFKPFKMADDLQRKAYLFQLNSAGKVSDTTLLADSDLDQNDENQIMIRETDKRIEATKKQQLAMATIQGEAQQIMLKYQTKAQQDAQKAMTAPVAPGEPGGADVQGQGGGPGGAGGEGPSQAMPVGMQEGAAANAAGPMGGAAPASAQTPGPASGVGPSPQDFLSMVSSQLTGAQKIKEEQQTNVDLPTYAMGQARLLVTLPKPQQEMALKNLQLQSPELADLVKQMMVQLVPPEEGDSGSAGVDTRPRPEQKPPRRAGGI